MRFGYFLLWSTFRWIFKLLFHSRIHQSAKVPMQGPVLLASNHASFMDPPLIGSSLDREICYLARESLFSFPVFGQILRFINVIPVDRDGRSPRGLKAIAGKLESGNAVILFPEGTRSPDGTMQTAKSGIGLLAIKSDAPVIPVRVFGTFEAYGRHMRWPNPYPVTVTFGDPLPMEALRAEAKTASKDRVKEIYMEATRLIMEGIQALEPCSKTNRFG